MLSLIPLGVHAPPTCEGRGKGEGEGGEKGKGGEERGEGEGKERGKARDKAINLKHLKTYSATRSNQSVYGALPTDSPSPNWTVSHPEVLLKGEIKVGV